jgi:site-specific DNA-adenine methylase
MFLHLMSKGIRFNTCLSDINVELITTYTAVKDNVKEVIELLQKYETEYKNATSNL